MKHFLKLAILCYFLLGNTFAQKRVACIGDSVTEGLGIPSTEKNYPQTLQQFLGGNFKVENFGNSGSTLLSKGHKPYIYTEQFKRALAFKPDIIVISLGLNDTDPRNWPNYKSEFAADYTKLITSFREVNKDVQVFVCNLTPIFSGHRRYLSGTRNWFDQIQALIPQIAVANGASLIDNHGPLASRIDLFEDNLHPNSQGASIIAQQVSAAVKGVAIPLAVHESIGSNMVLQRETTNLIHGSASTHTTVEVLFNNNSYKTKADNNGFWSVNLPATKAGGPFEITIKAENETRKLTNILFGDVYLASGQSNMAFNLKSALRSKELIEKGLLNKNIRLFKNKQLVQTNSSSWDPAKLKAINDLAFFKGAWEMADKENLGDFSAIAYAFAYEIAAKENIPVGIIDIAVGGTNTESWLPRKTLENDDLVASYIHNWRTSDFIQDFCKTRTNENLANATLKNQRHPYGPAYNFEAGISKWLKTKVKAVLWYQGESNTHNLELHEHLFKTLVSSWRDAFHQNLPFYFVQLSSIDRPSWPSFRDSQRLLANEMSDVHMAVSSDLGDSLDVHPKEKITIGLRLANLVRKHEYHEKINADTPQPTTYQIKGNLLTVYFNNSKALKTRNAEPLTGFQLVNHKGEIIVVKDVLLTKNKVQIKLPEQNVKALQYAYAPFTRANLENESGVPVSTFNIAINK